MKTLYVSDLDGTLLNNNARLSPFAIETINGLVRRGVAFTFATARSFTSAKIVTQGLALSLPVVTFNGAFMVEPSTGEILDRRLLTAQQRAFSHRLASERGLAPLVYSFIEGRERVSYLNYRNDAWLLNYLSTHVGDPRMRPVSTINELFVGDVFYMSYIGEKCEMQPLQLFFREDDGFCVNFQEDTYTKDEYWLEVFGSEATKAAGVLRLKRRLNAERLVCFGDNLNDMSMFGVSDECYAVENARDPLKELATAVIASNQGDGVPRWLLENAAKCEG